MPLDLKEAEVRTLFELMDADRDGELTPRGFVKGIRHFAPACVLEDLRVRCCQRHIRVSDAFSTSVEERYKPVDVAAFSQMLAELDLMDQLGSNDNDEQGSNIKIQEVFDLLDVKHTGNA